MLKIRYRQDRYESPCALVLGCFDGIHKGHALLIDEAKRTGLPVGLMLLEGKGEDELFTREERLWIAEREGVDFCLLVTLDHETMTTPPEAFLFEITSRIAVHTFVCGEDFRFGDGARGTPSLLAKAHRTIVCPLLLDGEGKIASSRIKQYVRSGEVERANALLSVPYFVRGEVRHGRGVGRTYGFPTANIAWDRAKCPPGLGVYAVSVGEYRGIANYGGRPTFGEEFPVLEVYIDGFEGDLYGETINVQFDQKIRNIRKFASKEELKAQLERDIAFVRGAI